MAEIVRAVCQNDSSGDSKSHRVKVTCEGVFKDLEIDSVNGLYLRKDDEVYVYTSNGTWYDAIILGRCNGQLELTDLVKVINVLIDVINKDKRHFDSHQHAIDSTAAAMIMSPAGPCTTTPGCVVSAPTDASGVNPVRFEKEMDDIKEDDLLHE